MVKQYKQEWKNREDYRIRENKTKKEELEAFKEVMAEAKKNFEADEPMIIITGNMVLARGSVVDMGGMIGSFIDKIMREDPYSKGVWKRMVRALDRLHDFMDAEDPFGDDVPSMEELKAKLEELKKAFGVEADIEDEEE